jgi:hypothetical protein
MEFSIKDIAEHFSKGEFDKIKMNTPDLIVAKKHIQKLMR